MNMINMRIKKLLNNLKIFLNINNANENKTTVSPCIEFVKRILQLDKDNNVNKIISEKQIKNLRISKSNLLKFIIGNKYCEHIVHIGFDLWVLMSMTILSLEG